MNWNDPEARFRLIEAIGVEAYNREFEAHRRSTILATVNGYAIRPVGSRFGLLFMVEGTGKAFPTKKAAEDFAAQQPKGNTP